MVLLHQLTASTANSSSKDISDYLPLLRFHTQQPRVSATGALDQVIFSYRESYPYTVMSYIGAAKADFNANPNVLVHKTARHALEDPRSHRKRSHRAVVHKGQLFSLTTSEVT